MMTALCVLEELSVIDKTSVNWTRRRAQSINGRRAQSSPTFPFFPLSSHPAIAFLPHINMASRPEIKEEDESGFCKFFRNLPEKDDETVRIFDRGDYYSAHGEDAKFIANTVSTNELIGVWLRY